MTLAIDLPSYDEVARTLSANAKIEHVSCALCHWPGTVKLAANTARDSAGRENSFCTVCIALVGALAHREFFQKAERQEKLRRLEMGL